MNRLSVYFFVLLFAICFTACGDDDSMDEEVREVTTLFFTVSGNDASNSITFVYRDLDGEGGSDPEIVGATLKDFVTYTGVVEVVKETGNPFDLSDIIKTTEAREHQFFYTTSVGDIDFMYEDMDSNGDPVGLTVSFTPTVKGVGMLDIELRYLPNKSAANVSEGDVTNAGGSEVIKVSLPLTVE